MREKRSHESMYKTDKKKCSKEVKSENFCYGKIRIAVEKSATVIAILENLYFDSTLRTICQCFNPLFIVLLLCYCHFSVLTPNQRIFLKDVFKPHNINFWRMQLMIIKG